MCVSRPSPSRRRRRNEKELTHRAQKMASNLTGQVRSISLVTKAVANGDLSKTMEVDVSGEMLDLKVRFRRLLLGGEESR